MSSYRPHTDRAVTSRDRAANFLAARPPYASASSSTHRGTRSRVARERRRQSWQARSSIRRLVDGHLRDRLEQLPKERVRHSPIPTSPDVSDASGGLDCCGFTFLHANIRGFSSKTDEIAHLIARANYPTFAGFTETFLKYGGKNPPEVSVAGYVQIARLDRRTDESQGGIILFARAGFEQNIVHVGDSDVFERSWFIIHSDRGPILLGLWYRRPDRGEIASVISLADELNQFGAMAIHTIVMGDFNCHEAPWLRFSDGSSAEGRELHDIANAHGLEEKVGRPTRGEYLLDLVLTDMGSDAKCKVIDGVSDHDAVIGEIKFGVPEVHQVQRELFDYKKAPWHEIQQDFDAVDWQDLFAGLTADDTAEAFTEVMTRIIRKHVPSKMSWMRISSHPWLNDRCRATIDAKIRARGTANERSERDKCSSVLLDEYNAYVAKTKAKLSELPGSSKMWWKMSNALQGKSSKGSTVQSLKRSDESWARSGREKAELLSDTFVRKSRLPESVTNAHTEAYPNFPQPTDGFLRVRRRQVLRILKKMKVDSATGLDGIAARVLKQCAGSLAFPIALVLRLMLQEGRWPQCWRIHRIVPLFKRKARSDPGNYRGIHLTSQVSKVVERVMADFLRPMFARHNAFGPRQFAYARGRGYRDALALMTLSWLRGMERGNLIAVYCSDVSGAFDRVCEVRLGSKLRRIGLHPRICALLLSWLEPRVSEVVVDGETARRRTLANSVYQGTVLGPPLWNVHYADAAWAVRIKGFLEIIFADDLNCVKEFGPEVSKVVVENELRECQAELHSWGAANRVLFDAGKESFHGLHRGRNFGDDFKILGVLYDTQLTMVAAVLEVAREAGWRLKTLLRCRRFYTTPQLVKLYKSQILSYIESSTPAIHHAAPSVLDKVDRVQRRFLRETGISEESALVDYRLAPLQARRDMAMLGMLHRIVHGIAPLELSGLFVPVARRNEGMGTRTREARHIWQLQEFVTAGGHTEVYRRSAFGLVTVWNMVPSELAAAKSTKTLQRHLQQGLGRYMESGELNWTAFFSDAKRMTIGSFQAWFV